MTKKNAREASLLLIEIDKVKKELEQVSIQRCCLHTRSCGLALIQEKLEKKLESL